MNLSGASIDILANRYNMTAPDRLERVVRRIQTEATAYSAVLAMMSDGIPLAECRWIAANITEMSGWS
jgi:hypothetical protein